MGDDRCRHDLLPGQCADCGSRFPARVWITAGGAAFHRRPDCSLLREGQQIARGYRQQTHAPEQVALAVAQGQSRGECSECFARL